MRFLAAALAMILALFGCGFYDQGNPINRIAEEWAAIPPIPPGDTASAFLDSATVAFETKDTNHFDYSCVSSHEIGGLGPDYMHFAMTVKSMPAGDSILVKRIGQVAEGIRIPTPPVKFRRDSSLLPELPPYGDWLTESVRKLFPSKPEVPNGIFVMNDGRKLIVIIDSSLIGARASNGKRIYLEPYGLIDFSLYEGAGMNHDFLSCWIDRRNGQTIDKDLVFGGVKGLLDAYKVRNARSVELESEQPHRY